MVFEKVVTFIAIKKLTISDNEREILCFKRSYTDTHAYAEPSIISNW